MWETRLWRTPGCWREAHSSPRTVPRARHPPSECSAGISEMCEVIVVIPAEGLDLLEQVESFEVPSELQDKWRIEFWVEGIFGKTVFEIIEDVEDVFVEG